MLPDQPFYLSVNELALKAVDSAQSADSDPGTGKFSTTVRRSQSRMVLVHFGLKSEASALNEHTASISVNGNVYRGLPFTMINVTELLSSFGENELVIWGPPIPEHVTVYADVVKKVTEEELRRWMTDSAPYVHTRANFAALARALYAGAYYAPVQQFQVPLPCPMTGNRMRVPGRGVRCRHLKCFDVFAYLGSNESTLQPSWRCPVCSEQVLVQDIRIDRVLLDAISIAP